jgi:long-chain fatty acid transport protein
MNRNIARWLLGLALGALTLAPRAAHGAGFLVYDVSGEALGRASAMTADPTQPSAVFFNPAGLVFQEGQAVSLGGLFVTATGDFQPLGTDDRIKSKQLWFELPTIYGAFKVTPWMSLGVGMYTIFGLGVEWPETWMGREHAIKAAIQSVTFSATASFKLWKNLSLGVGVNVVRATVDMTNGLPEPIGGVVRIAGGAYGAGAHAALLWRAVPDKFHVGATYHSRVKFTFDGRADFDPAAQEFARDLPDQGGKAAITFPDILSIGLMYRPLKQLAITFDVTTVMWSTYDKLTLDFERPESPDQTFHRDCHDSVTVRIGLDWATPVKGLNARLGFIFDQNPAPADRLSPSLPDANRVDIGVGLGYTIKWFTVDVGYLLVNFLPSKATTGRESPEGTYRTMAHLMGLTLTGRWGVKPAASEPERVAPPADERPAPPVEPERRVTPPAERPPTPPPPAKRTAPAAPATPPTPPPATNP